MTPPPLPSGPETATPSPDVASLPVSELVKRLLTHPERIETWLSSPRALGMGRLLGLLVLGAAVLYGLVVGSFSGGVQWWAAPVKVAAGIALSTLLCLPSFYVFTCLAGMEIRPARIGVLLTAMLAIDFVLLASLAPVAWIFSQSSESVAVMGFIHLLLWGVASGFGFRWIHRSVEPGNRPQGVLHVWCALFLLVTLQMTTALRPLVGKSDTFLPTEKRFFLDHWGRTLSGRD